MGELERFANDDSLSSLDPLVKMAVIHHQFESIHPFCGRERKGRTDPKRALLGPLRAPRDAHSLPEQGHSPVKEPNTDRLLQAVRDDGAGGRTGWSACRMRSQAHVPAHFGCWLSAFAALMAEIQMRNPG